MIRGAVYRVDFGDAKRGHEQRGRRYAVVISPGSMPWSVVTVVPTSTSAQPAVFRPELEVMEQRHGSWWIRSGRSASSMCTAIRSTIWTVTKWPRWNTPWHDTLVCDGRRICKWATDLALRWSCRESNPGPTAFPQGFSVRSSLCLCSDLPVTRTSRDDDPSRCGCPEESRDRTHRWIPLADARVRAEGVPGLTD